MKNKIIIRLPSRSAKPAADPHKGWHAVYQSRLLSVRTPRGRTVFAKEFESPVTFAVVRGNRVEVETAAGGRYRLDVDTGDLVAVEQSPTVAPAGPAATAA